MATLKSNARLLCLLTPFGFAACAVPDGALGGDEGSAPGERASAVCDTWPDCGPEDDDPPPPPPPPPPARPNLQVVLLNGASNDPSSPFCGDPNSGGNVIFRVQNVGVADAGASTVRVSDPSGAHDYAVPPLSPGDTHILWFYLDRSHPGDSSFSIRADYYRVVTESNENDNYVAGYCIG